MPVEKNMFVELYSQIKNQTHKNTFLRLCLADLKNFYVRGKVGRLEFFLIVCGFAVLGSLLLCFFSFFIKKNFRFT